MWPDDVPDHDFWLFDDEVWTMRYDEQGRFIRIEVDNTPEVVEDHRRASQNAYITASPLISYL